MKIYASILVVALLALAWAFRWQAIELHPAGDHPAPAYLLNRWTGEIRYLQDASWMTVDELKK